MFPHNFGWLCLHVAYYDRTVYQGSIPSSQPVRKLVPPLRSAMATKPQRSKGRDGTLSSLNVAIEALNLAKEAASFTPAKAAFGSVSILLTMIRVCFSSPATVRSMFTYG